MLALQLQRLETKLTDGSGRRPHSPEWLAYWGQRLTRVLTGEEPGQPGCIPLEVWDAIGEMDGVPDAAQPVAVSAGASPEIATDNA